MCADIADLVSAACDALKADVTVALWTPQGRGAVATIKVCGNVESILQSPNCPVPFRAANGRPLAAQPLGRVVFGTWGTQPAEEVVVCRVSDEELEIHCHGGAAAARRILADWQSLHIPVVDWRQQSNQSTSVLDTDCREAIAHATTLRTAAILLDQETAWLELARRCLVGSQLGDWAALKNDVSTALSWRELGRHLIEPFEVVLTGPPNVGKSALLNALVGYQRSVVFDQPGTTRDIVTAETAVDGWPVRLIDTAGLRDDATGLEAAGIELAHAQLVHADLVLQVSDASVTSDKEYDSTTRASQTILVANKIDLVPDASLALDQLPQAIAVSARTGVGLECLIENISTHLVPTSPAPGTVVPFRSHQRDWLRGLSVAIEQQNSDEVARLSMQIRC